MTHVEIKRKIPTIVKAGPKKIDSGVTERPCWYVKG